MTFAYRRGRWISEHFVLVAGACFSIAFGGSAPLAVALAGACAVALAWGTATLHFPHDIELSDETIAFRAYGRAHVFSWRDVRSLRVRRFLVRDRVLVRLGPTRAWRGRYWLTDGLEGYETLIEDLERRARAMHATP